VSIYLKRVFSEEYIKSARLINRSNSNNTFYDYFRNRIMFPVFDTSGNIIGFGGRVLSNSMPKYLNTPETDVFLKGRNLYGLYQARESIRVQGQAILVEGYIDCIKLHQAGINNVVASLGTALTQHQAKILRRYANEVLIIYDGDEAGQREASRAMQVLLDEDLKVYIVVLPDNRDPDEYVDLYGKKGVFTIYKE
jgi:DNA primase